MADFDVEIVRWDAVACWTWNAGEDVCAVCRCPFDGCPPEAKYPGDDSPIAWGTCKHAFHLSCITRWISSQSEDPRCPICRSPWEFAG